MIENNNKKVFDHDWFAIPFLITTCQPNGIFDTPDWATFKCVIRKFSHKHPFHKMVLEERKK